jgi:aarF domain-containing kinase
MGLHWFVPHHARAALVASRTHTYYCRQVFKHVSSGSSTCSAADAQNTKAWAAATTESVGEVLQRLSAARQSLCKLERHPKLDETRSTPLTPEHSHANRVSVTVQTAQDTADAPAHGSNASLPATPAPNLGVDVAAAASLNTPEVQSDRTSHVGNASDVIASHADAYEALLQHSMQREPPPPTVALSSPVAPAAAHSLSFQTAAAQQDALWSEVQNMRMISLSTARSVPSSPFSRVAGFGQLGLGMAAGAVGEFFKRSTEAASGSSSAAAPSALDPSLFLTQENGERLAASLSKMRGAALKLGQMLSMQDEGIVPAQWTAILDRVRQGADPMPQKQLLSTLHSELGASWQQQLSHFKPDPIASASIGQVHAARMLDGRVVAMKVQYPGVARSIDSDLDNLLRVSRFTNILPPGLYAEHGVAEMRKELRAECDYLREANCQRVFKQTVGNDPFFYVPDVIGELSSKHVLTTEFVRGVSLERAVDLPQDTRDMLAREILRLCLQELFVWRLMQTDPNWSNFLYDHDAGRLNLIDFGALREYADEFVSSYQRLVVAASNGDRATLTEESVRLGFLTGKESKSMLDAHCDAGMIGELYSLHLCMPPHAALQWENRSEQLGSTTSGAVT